MIIRCRFLNLESKEYRPATGQVAVLTVQAVVLAESNTSQA